MAYPLFQSTLKSSTPFPGTMAETSTPTPADGAQEQVSPYVERNQADLAANEQADEAKRLERIQFLEQQKRAKLAEITKIQNMQWVGNTKKYARLGPERYKKWQQTAMNGTREFEPPEMMYQRLQIIERMSGEVMQMQEQIRLESRLSPYQEAYRAEKGQDQANLEDVQARLDWWNGVNEQLPEGHKLPPDTLLALAQNPTASTSGRYPSMDPIARATAGAELGAKAGEAAADDPSIPDPLRNVVRLGAKQDAKVRSESSAKKAAADKPDHTNTQLFYMGQKELANALNVIPKSGRKMVKKPNPLGPSLPSVEQEVEFHTEEDLQKARAMAINFLPPTFLELYPTWLKDGDAAQPSTAPDPAKKAGDQGQKGVKPDIKALLKARKPKAQ